MVKYIAPVVLLLASCAGGLRVSPTIFSIEDLLATSHTSNNAIVEVRGFAVIRQEAHFICQSLNEVDSGSGRSCLWLAPTLKDGAFSALDPRDFDKKELVIVGVFDRDNRGHGGAYGGAIAPLHIRQVGKHDRGDLPPAPPEPSANNPFKPTPLRGAA